MADIAINIERDTQYNQYEAIEVDNTSTKPADVELLDQMYSAF
jgi:hypothetical protein